MSASTTPSQTVGPFFSLGLHWEDGPAVVPGGAPGAVWLRGRVLDGAAEDDGYRFDVRLQGPGETAFFAV